VSGFEPADPRGEPPWDVLPMFLMLPTVKA
jgi:hypothetical protein